jgi:hypothetical protein
MLRVEAGCRPDVKTADVIVVLVSSLRAGPNSETTRRAIAGAGSMKLTGQGASRRRRSMMRG